MEAMTAAALLAALLLQGPGPGAPPGPTPLPAFTGERAALAVQFPPWQFTGTFTLDVAGRHDQGVARDSGALVIPEQRVERVLEGRLGTLTLRLDTRLRRASAFPIFGHWRVVRGTGAYASLRGGGTFTSINAGTGSGSPFERQTLLGRLAGW
jgi:hypothetical protein